MSENLNKLKRLLAELFQFDQADLDFGIYRIMSAKRDEIIHFIDNDLLPQIKEAFQQYQGEDRVTIQAKLDEAIKQAMNLGADPESMPLIKKLRADLAYAPDIIALQNDVYSHLYNFFRRYYSEGDFISLRRYKEGVYAIPYEGEEVKLYWANHDQYYIKTSENFHNYTFKLPSGKKVTFKITEAETERDNNKAKNGNERRFILGQGDKETGRQGDKGRGDIWDIEDGELIIFFRYVPDPERRKQSQLNAEAIERLKALFSESSGLSVSLSDLFAPCPTEKNPDRTLLEKHLNDYTAKNTFDYFIHKDLEGFLRRELDFYIKNEVMHLDDIENETAPRVEQYLNKIKVIRKIAHKLIEFLAQIENFQKKLWLKKKFVVETNYCVTLDRVPEDLYPEIAANEAQLDEWRRLFDWPPMVEEVTEVQGDMGIGRHGDRETWRRGDRETAVLFNVHDDAPSPGCQVSPSHLKANPYLVLDTRHFGEDFKRRLVASFKDLDEQCDGLLIHSENFQALNLLLERYRGQVKCIYIDPPYNTGNDEFTYKDRYQHSSWLAMLFDRLAIAQKWLMSDGLFWQSVDDNEEPRARLIGELVFGPLNHVANVIWQKKYTRANDARWFSDNHDYILVFAKNKEQAQIALLPRTEEQESAYSNPDNDPRGPWKATPLHAKSGNGAEFIYTFKNGVTWSPPPGTFPRYSPETLERLYENNELWFGPDGKTTPARKSFLSKVKQGVVPVTIWPYDEVGHNHEAINELKALFPENPFSNPKPTRLIRQVAFLSEADIILDFFAGSGTTAHAVINLNREDGGSRKYILVEMGEYFDTVLVPRIKKVVYSKDWKDGKPVSREGISHMFKYIRLESYEDALNNLELKRSNAQQRLLDEHPAFREDYMLRYMLDTESRGSSSLLNLDRFEDPFSYTLNISLGTVGETKTTVVDLVETFNYLIGLTVHHIDHIEGFRVVTGTRRQGDKGTGRVLIIWRNLKEKSNEDLDEFFSRQEYNQRGLEFDLIYVNGDNNLENLRKPDQTWKVRLIEEEFKRRMFDVEDV